MHTAGAYNGIPYSGRVIASRKAKDNNYYRLTVHLDQPIFYNGKYRNFIVVRSFVPYT